MKRIKILFTMLIMMTIGFVFMQSCKTPESISQKSGAQLWGENCMRCHNEPSPADYGDNQWDVVGEHMRLKANLTDAEVQKVVDFMKMAN